MAEATVLYCDGTGCDLRQEFPKTASSYQPEKMIHSFKIAIGRREQTFDLCKSCTEKIQAATTEAVRPLVKIGAQSS